jgi:hypothetical protein
MMGMIEIVVALCLQAEPAACRVTRERHRGSASACAKLDSIDGETASPGWYLARWSCRWRS